jgi:hypothetical protein
MLNQAVFKSILPGLSCLNEFLFNSTHGDLNGVMQVSDAVVAPQEQSAPDHRADAAPNHLELVNA